MQLGHLLRRALVAELRSKQLGEQPVIAVPGPPWVNGDDECVGALELGQPLGAVQTAGNGVGQPAADLVGDAGVEQEVADLRRLAGEHLGKQIVGHGAVVAGEGGHEPGRVGVPVQGQKGQPKPRRPAFGARPQGGDVRNRPPVASSLTSTPREAAASRSAACNGLESSRDRGSVPPQRCDPLPTRERVLACEQPPYRGLLGNPLKTNGFSLGADPPAR